MNGEVFTICFLLRRGIVKICNYGKILLEIDVLYIESLRREKL